MAPALGEGNSVFEQGKPRIVKVDILKEFRGENNVHGLPSDPPHPSFQGGDEITEIPSLGVEKPTAEGIRRQDRQPGRSDRDTGAGTEPEKNSHHDKWRKREGIKGMKPAGTRKFRPRNAKDR